MSDLIPADGDTIAVWFSCGAASAVAAKRTIAVYGDRCRVRVINNPIKEEHPDNQRFLRDVEQWIGVQIETAINPEYPAASCVEVWGQRGFMSGPKGAPCTLHLKKRARQHWENNNPCDWIVLGFTADEAHRAERFSQNERDNLIPILVTEGITKQGCFDILLQSGLQLPEIYRLGYSNANCIGCVKATSATYWNRIRQTHPNEFAARAEQSRRIGAKLVRVKGKRIFLDELDPNAQGRPMKDYDIECGIFCEENE